MPANPVVVSGASRNFQAGLHPPKQGPIPYACGWLPQGSHPVAQLHGRQKKIQRTVYIRVNGKLILAAGDPPFDANFKDISLRSISELMRCLFYKTSYQGYVTTRNADSKFRIAYLLDTVSTGNSFEFDIMETRRLFKVGCTTGGDRESWADEPPRLEPLERVEAAKR